MTTPSGGSPDDETWRRPEQPATAGENASTAVPRDGAGARPAGPGFRLGAPGGGHDPDRTEQPAVTAGQPEQSIPAADPAVTDRSDTAGAAGTAETPEASGAAHTPEAAGNASPWSREAATESPWARPEAAGGWTVAGGAWPGPPGGGPPGGGPPPSGYAGPPPSTPPPPGWRPPVHVQPSPPRRLPPQDMAAMDQAEQRAQRLTYGIGAAVAVVLVLLTCLLCSRVLF
ncbi:hypothetical protein ACGFI5_01735 [Micromonospora tulbaghiae]|uniref:hypothetical protein n=1 Tax=Micromonospora tulbaghiae TaxID=479978 RepID=UPI001112EB32|nr:hypothetical protein [Micromonospora tulbaghiae]MDX5456299.1 hypothetical protein [Micromonospora tulbaghiae]